MTHSDVDRFHDQLLDEDARAAFLVRVAEDVTLKRDLAFRAELDARLRLAFEGTPSSATMSDFAKMVVGAGRSKFGRFAMYRIAAALLLTATLVYSLWGPDRTGVDAGLLWKELTPVLDCRAPVIDSNQLAQHCVVAHGASLQIVLSGKVYVHGPTKSSTFPGASVLTVVFPASIPGEDSDIRIVLIGDDLPIRAAAGVHVFRRTVKGVQVVEMTTATEPRALGLLH